MSSSELIRKNPQQWDICINDACNTAHPNQIHALFAIILTSCFPSSHTELWERYRSHMAEDILRRVRLENGNMAMEFTEGIYNETLINIEDKCLTIANKVLIQLGMPAPTRAEIGSFDVDLRREQSYNISDFQLLILATVRSKNDIALALASSGIAAILLPGGRTAHSALKLPWNIQTINTPTCNISKTSGMPPHILKLKIGVPVIMLRNINQPKLCNGTRLAVKKFMNIVVEATILTGPFKGDVLILRIHDPVRYII
ncbi:ATP-dependent DNA helicase [Trichonephila clavipes]|nr:ATP-dependent DNA helicase [Trichonephila clavipes]